ncbi:MAG TPA: LCP family protein [Solirubrobacteraceae bacterium]|jgi:LCP family protein required for cell wall assembly
MPNDAERRQGDLQDRPYTLYRSSPRGLRSRLGGDEPEGFGPPGAAPPGAQRRWRLPWRRGGGPATVPGRPITARRVLKYLLIALVFWFGLSFVLFMISASNQAGTIPASAKAQLSSGGNMVFSADNILIIGTDQRPRTGPGSKEPGSNYNDAGSRSDTIMIWRVGGGTSRRLSIPRDTAVAIPGHGRDKINAAYALGGPALLIKTVKEFTGLKINHIIIVNLGNFPKFIDAIGGVTIHTGRICANISGGRSNGGFTVNLRPGDHHLSGLQALLVSRIRENSCNPSENDLTREKRQQQVLNAIKGQLISFHTFFHLPWAAWDAPQALRSDMGGFSLMSLFFGSEIGGSAPIDVLKPTGSEVLPNGGDALTVTPGAVHSAVNKLMNG